MLVVKAIAYLVDKRGDNSQLWEFGRKVSNTFRAGDQIEEKDSLFRHAPRYEDLDSHDCGTAYLYDIRYPHSSYGIWSGF